LFFSFQGKRETFFLISRHWHSKWTKYVFASGPHAVHPGEVNNYGLLVQNEIYSLQEACINCILNHGIDYRILPRDIVENIEKIEWSGGVDFYKKKTKPWTMTLKPHLQEKEDYIRIPQEYWQKILAHYGGGPSIPSETEQ
jgi:hypothetical protein